MGAGLIVLLSFVYLYLKNSDVLFMAQLQSLFLSGATFFHDCMEVPGGLLAWAGCWFTQLFYNTWIGVAALSAIWLATFFVIKKAYGIREEWRLVALLPIGCLAASVIDLGYWIYYLKIQGYYFRESLGVLVVALLLWMSRVNELKMLKESRWLVMATDIIVIAVCAALYVCIGWYALLALVLLVLRHALAKRWLSMAVSVAAAVAVPLVCLQFYNTMRSDEAFFVGFPLFQNGVVTAWHLSLPFFIIIGCLVLFHFLPKEEMAGKKSWLAYAVSVVAVALSWYFVGTHDFDNENYHAELKMYRSVDEQNWERALDEARGIHGDATREIVIFKNVALMNVGRVGTEMYHYSNMGEPPYVEDSLRVRLVQTAAPMIYLHHGKTNFAIRWCIENSVEFGLSVNNIKIVVQSALVNGEYKLARKFIDILSRTMYYKEWAERYRLIVDGKMSIARYKELKNIRELYDHMGSRLDADQGVCEMFLLNYFSGTMNKDSKYLQEMTLMYSLISKDIQKFWPHFFLYAQLHQNQEMPIHYQEAAYLYGVLEPQTMDTSKMPFDEKMVKERYASFSQISQQLLSTGMQPEEVGRQMESEFGDTFWWFYFFCRGVHSY